MNDPDQAKLAPLYQNDSARFFSYPLPKSIAGRHRVLASVLLVPRKHLPQGYITRGGGLMPVFVHQDTPAVVIVPSRWWPEWLLERWTETDIT